MDKGWVINSHQEGGHIPENAISHMKVCMYLSVRIQVDIREQLDIAYLWHEIKINEYV